MPLFLKLSELLGTNAQKPTSETNPVGEGERSTRDEEHARGEQNDNEVDHGHRSIEEANDHEQGEVVESLFNNVPVKRKVELALMDQLLDHNFETENVMLRKKTSAQAASMRVPSLLEQVRALKLLAIFSCWVG